MQDHELQNHKLMNHERQDHELQNHELQNHHRIKAESREPKEEPENDSENH